MRIAYWIAYDSGLLRVMADDSSPTGLFRLQTAVEQIFPGVQIAPDVQMVAGLCFSLAGYRGEHDLSAMDTSAFNQALDGFDPVLSVRWSGESSEVHAQLQFEVTAEFCDRLAGFMRHLEVTKIAPQQLPSSQTVVLDVEPSKLSPESLGDIIIDLRKLLSYVAL